MGQLQKLREKIFFEGNIHIYLFALNGFTDAVKAEAEKDGNIYLFDLNDIFFGSIADE